MSSRLEPRSARIGDIQMRWYESGTGRPLVLLHGIPSSAAFTIEAELPWRMGCSERMPPVTVMEPPSFSQVHVVDDALWLFEHEGRTETATVGGRLRINLYNAIRRAALAGAGAVRLPLFQVREELESGALVRLCPGYELVAMPLYLLYPSRRHQPLRTRVFIDFLLRWFQAPERRELLT